MSSTSPEASARVGGAPAALFRIAIASLGVDVSEILMVAAHNYDLNSAKSQDFRTAFVHRPEELGPDGTPGNHPDPDFDINATSLIDLADQLRLHFRQSSNLSVIIESAKPSSGQPQGNRMKKSGDGELKF